MFFVFHKKENTTPLTRQHLLESNNRSYIRAPLVIESIIDLILFNQKAKNHSKTPRCGWSNERR